MLRPALMTAIALMSAAPTAAADRWDEQFSCYWVRGRLSAYNGTPSLRIWPRGTHRLLGVVGTRPSMDSEDPKVLPPRLRNIMGEDRFAHDIWAKFRVCPVEPERAGRMRMVYIADAKVLAVIDKR